MKMRLNHVLIGLTPLFAVVIFMFLSFMRARTTADAVTLSVHDEWYYYDTVFILRHPSGGGPAWSVRYDARNIFASRPISVDVGLFGNVRRTTPDDLIEQINKHRENASNEALEAIGDSAPQP